MVLLHGPVAHCPVGNVTRLLQLRPITAATGPQFCREIVERSGRIVQVGCVMRAPVYDLYQMKQERLPQGAGSAWLRTRPNEPPPSVEDWVFVGKERHPSKWTIAEMNEKGTCYREIPIWLTRRAGATAAASAESSAA
jgi:hypothetical protein